MCLIQAFMMDTRIHRIMGIAPSPDTIGTREPRKLMWCIPTHILTMDTKIPYAPTRDAQQIIRKKSRFL